MGMVTDTGGKGAMLFFGPGKKKLTYGLIGRTKM
jgi:hypothetical protein